jgi:hypothetical protein
VSLPASFNLWLASPEAAFLKGRFVWANWDVNELMPDAKAIEKAGKSQVGLFGWPFAEGEVVWKFAPAEGTTANSGFARK